MLESKKQFACCLRLIGLQKYKTKLYPLSMTILIKWASIREWFYHYRCPSFVSLLSDDMCMENVIEKIKTYYPVSAEALEALTSLFEKIVFPAKTIIIHAGKLDRKVYFIEKGITRSYVLHGGKEITTWFSMEGDAACGSWDLCRHKAGFEYVETLEETTAYSVSVEQLDALYRSYIDLANWMRVLQQENFLRLQDTHIRRLNWPAQERYEHLTRECPGLFLRVNLGYIASFLGITQQSLSRIRSKGRFLT